MPLSKRRDRLRKRAARRAAQRASGPHVLAPATVRLLRAAGLDPEALPGPVVPQAVYSALRLDRDAIAAHLSWHHDSELAPDAATLLERARQDIATLQARVLAIEADQVVREAPATYGNAAL